MTLSRFEKIGILALFVLACVALYEVHRADVAAAVDRAQLNATLKQQSDVIAQLKADQSKSETDNTKRKDAIDQQLKDAKTIAQQAQLVSQMAGLKQPIALISPAISEKSDMAKSDGKKLPDAPVAQLNQSQLWDLSVSAANCKKCESDRTALQEQLADETSKSDALEKEVNAAVNNARGGSKWQRFKRGAKQIAIGAAVGFAAGQVAHR